MGALLLMAGAKGKRFMLPHSRVMIHQPWGGASGTAADIRIQADEIVALKKTLNGLIATHTGQTEKQVEKDTDRDTYMSADASKDYGIVDEIIQNGIKPHPTDGDQPR